MVEARNVTVGEALILLNEGAYLLDVRENNEFESGRADVATQIPLSGVPDYVDALPKDHLIVCVCRSGVRSARAARFLVEKGLDAVNLEGGMLAWRADGQPIVGDVDEPTIL